MRPDRPVPGAQARRKRGRPRKGEFRYTEPPRRIERQRGMPLTRDAGRFAGYICDVGVKRNARTARSWIGYKLHIDSADGEIPIWCVLTSAQCT